MTNKRTTRERAEIRHRAKIALAAYINAEMLEEMGVVMPEFSDSQADVLLNSVDSAITRTKNDPRAVVIGELVRSQGFNAD